MSYPVFQVPAGDVLPILFSTYAGATGASVTATGLAVTDIEIYKDGSVTQRASDAGYTLLDTDGLDFDGLTGIHGFSIDTGDNTDAGFYTVGAWFTVVVSAITVDSQTVSFIAAQFRLMAAETVAGAPKVDVHAVSGDTAAADNCEAWFDGTGYASANSSVASVTGSVGSVAANGITASSLATDAGAELADAVWDEALSGHVTAGSVGAALNDTNLRGSRVVCRGTVGSATTPSTTQFTPSALSPSGSATDQFKGRVIIFDVDTTTAALRGQATDITASSAAALPLFTYSALSTAPASGDTFTIV